MTAPVAYICVDCFTACIDTLQANMNIHNHVEEVPLGQFFCLIFIYSVHLHWVLEPPQRPPKTGAVCVLAATCKGETQQVLSYDKAEYACHVDGPVVVPLVERELLETGACSSACLRTVPVHAANGALSRGAPAGPNASLCRSNSNQRQITLADAQTRTSVAARPRLQPAASALPRLPAGHTR